MTINTKHIAIIAKIAGEIVKTQTQEDLVMLVKHGQEAYTQATLAAEIATKLVLRIIGMDVETRGISPIDSLVDTAEIIYTSNFAG